MLQTGAVTSTYCFIETPAGLAQVLRAEVTSDEPTRVRAWAQGPGISTAQAWEGELSPGRPARAEVAVLVQDGPVRRSLPIELVLAGEDGPEHRSQHDFERREPGWQMFMVSHFHYDPVWWNTQAGYTSGWDELTWAQDRRDSFQHTGLVLVESHLERSRLDPSYKFVLAEVDYLQPFWHLYPDRRAELRRLLQEGRLEIVGGTYNEPNTNLTSYETAARCAVYGWGFQRDVMGGRPETAWQLDVFGHDPSFPSLMASSGITSSSWARGPFHQWGPKHHTGSTSWMQFPSEFEWLGPDGQGLLTSYMPDHYSAGWKLDQATTLEQAMADAYDLFCDLAAVSATKATLLPVGTDYTPPNLWVTKVAQAWADRYAWPRFVNAVPADFFSAVREELAAQGRSPLPQTREMGPVYTGKDVSFIDTKQANRLAETTLVEAEKLAALASLHGHRVPRRPLDKAWRQLAFNSHHDAITGSESDQVYLDLLGGWREAYELALQVRQSSARALLSGVAGARAGTAGALAVVNSLGFPRSGLVRAELDSPAHAGPAVRPVLTGPDGQSVPLVATFRRMPTSTGPGSVLVELVAADVPALGSQSYSLSWEQGPVPGWEEAEGAVAANEYFQVEAAPGRGGCLARVLHLGSGREVLAPGQLGNEILVYPEYSTHPLMGEGPWHLMPVGPPSAGSSGASAQVHKEVSPLGERLVVQGEVGGIAYRQVVSLLRGWDLVHLRTELHGFSGADQLVRLRFPTAVCGGVPVTEVGNAVVARSPGFADGPSGDAPWTLDVPVQTWAGVGATLDCPLEQKGRPVGQARLAVAEVVVPESAGPELLASVRRLVVALAAKGVTASCTWAGGNRYGGLLGDSNLPGTRIAVGPPAANAFTQQFLDAVPSSLATQVAAQLEGEGRSCLWVPAEVPLAQAWQPNADVRGPRQLPVLLLAGQDQGATASLVDHVAAQVGQGRLPLPLAGTPGPDEQSGDGFSVAILNRGTPGHLVGMAGDVYVSLLRSCTAWPSGIWIDPPRRTAPDGSHFELEHWSHIYEHALVAGEGDWREAHFCPQGQSFNTPLWAWPRPAEEATAAGREPVAGRGPQERDRGQSQASWLTIEALEGEVLVSALKPFGDPLARGLEEEPEGRDREERQHTEQEQGRPRSEGRPAGSGQPGTQITLRLYESQGRPAHVRLRGGAGVVLTRAWAADLLEQKGAELEALNGAAQVGLGPASTATVVLELTSVAGTAQPSPAGGEQPASPARDRLGQEPVPSVFSRYWLHNKGPAPMGNQLLSVHLSPVAARARPGETSTDLSVTVSSASASPQAGTLDIVVPEGWEVSPPGRMFNLAPGAFSQLPLRVWAPEGSRPGRYFVSARLTDLQGRQMEDVTTVDLLPRGPLGLYGVPESEPGTPSGASWSGAAWEHPANQVSSEISLELSTEHLVLCPGQEAVVELSALNRCRSEIRAEAQLISPWETWADCGPWSQPLVVPALGEASATFSARAPLDREPYSSWLLVKVMYFGRLWYSPAVRLDVVDP